MLSCQTTTGSWLPEQVFHQILTRLLLTGVTGDPPTRTLKPLARLQESLLPPCAKHRQHTKQHQAWHCTPDRITRRARKFTRSVCWDLHQQQSTRAITEVYPCACLHLQTCRIFQWEVDNLPHLQKKITCNTHDVCPNGMEYCRECLEVFNSKYFLNVFSVSYTEHYPNYKELVQRQTQVVLSIQIVLKESCSLNVNQPLSIGKKQFL